MLTQSEENYLKAIFTLSELKEKVSTNLLADKMSTKASSVTDMVKKLSEKELIQYHRYQGCVLTDSGKENAIQIVRKHRLWEVFLVDKLHFGWDEVHEIAEQLEHIKSPELTNRLDDFLGNPSHDPHGDPIPDRDGVFPVTILPVPLFEIEDDYTYVVTGVEDGSADFFQLLNHHGIGLGSPIQVVERFNFDHSLVVFVNQKEVTLTELVAKKIFVQKLEEE